MRWSTDRGCRVRHPAPAPVRAEYEPSRLEELLRPEYRISYYKSSEHKTIETQNRTTHYFPALSRLRVMSLTGAPFSSIKRTQKSLRPGPFTTAPRRMLRPLSRVSRLDTQSSIFMRRSVKRSTASLPLSHHIEAAFEPTAKRTFCISRELLTTVTAQKMTP